MKKFMLFLILSFSILFADSRVYQKKIDVTRSEPVYKTITKQVPYEECFDEEYEQKISMPTSRNNSYDNSLGLDTLLGVTGGVVVGNQIGRGNGRVAAKIIGGLLGGAIAHEIRNKNSTTLNADEYYYETKTIRKCETKYDTYTEEVQIGYKNYFVYNGKEIYKITKHPRKKIHIKNTISF